MKATLGMSSTGLTDLEGFLGCHLLYKNAIDRVSDRVRNHSSITGPQYSTNLMGLHNLYQCN